MDRLAKFDKDEFIRRMRAKFEATMEQVAQAVNAAPQGHLINASEEACRDVLGEFRRAAYQTALQMRIEATEQDVAFSPSGACPPRSGQPDGAQRLRPGPVASGSLRGSGRRDDHPSR